MFYVPAIWHHPKPVWFKLLPRTVTCLVLVSMASVLPRTPESSTFACFIHFWLYRINLLYLLCVLQARPFILLAVISKFLQIALVYEYLFFGFNPARRHVQKRTINWLISQFVPRFALCKNISHSSTCLLQCRRMSEMEFYGNAWEGVDFKRVARSEEGACCFDLEKGRPTWTPFLAERPICSIPNPNLSPGIFSC